MRSSLAIRSDHDRIVAGSTSRGTIGTGRIKRRALNQANGALAVGYNMTTMALIHHELCFGCGRANLFGLLLEARREPDGAVTGRWFVKQDHQGPEPGVAHPGLVMAALVEAMMLCAGEPVALRRIQVEPRVAHPIRVGAFCKVRAGVRRQDVGTVWVDALVTTDAGAAASATAEFARRPAAADALPLAE